jgi:hypothetical protein
VSEQVTAREPDEGATLLRYAKPKDVERAQVEAHPLYEPLVTLFGRPPARELPFWRDDIATLDEMGALPDDVPRVADAYSAIMGHDTTGRPILLTRPALVRHWFRCMNALDDEAPVDHTSQEAGAVAWAKRYGLVPDQPAEAAP